MRWTMILLGLVLLSPVRAQGLHLDSGSQPARVIELYTSEGCSSCPPAEAFLNAYTRDPKLWHEVIPMAFHVDYWDYLGWRDRFDDPANSQRQRRYARSLHMNTVYTPALFVDGQPWRNWRWGGLPDAQASPPGRLTVDVDGTRLVAGYQSAPPLDGLRMQVAILGMGLVSDIRAGENRGRRARHEFVVLARGQLSAGEGRWTGSVPKPKLKAERYALVVWVSRGQDPRPLRAVGAYLP